MVNDKIRIQVSGIRESEKSIRALVDLIFNDNGDYVSASREVWFPKSLCELEEIPSIDGYHHPTYFITAPKWFLEKYNIKTNIQNE